MVTVMTKRGVPVALWAAAAVGVTVIATAVVTASLGPSGPTLTPDQVAAALSTAPSTTSTRTATGAPTVTAGPTITGGEVMHTVPGTVVVECDGAVATLVSWSPNPGYRADDVVRGPAASVSVWFESDVASDVKVVATCMDGRASTEEQVEIDDHGGGDNSGRGGSGSSH